MEAEILDRWFAAFNTHDADGMCAVAHPDIEIIPIGLAETIPPGTVYHRHEGLRSILAPGFERFPRLRIDAGVHQMVAGHALVPTTFYLDDGNGAAPTGRDTTVVFRIVGGLIRTTEAFDTWAEAVASVERPGDVSLTPRERQIISLLSEGLNAEEVARELVISPFTVRTHVRNAKEKLGARTTGHAIAIVLRSRETAQ